MNTNPNNGFKHRYFLLFDEDTQLTMLSILKKADQKYEFKQVTEECKETAESDLDTALFWEVEKGFVDHLQKIRGTLAIRISYSVWWQVTKGGIVRKKYSYQTPEKS